MRYLLLAAIVALVIWYWRRSSPARPVAPPDAESPVQRMVQCRHCGVYVPIGDALKSGDAYYCSREHRDAPGQEER